MAIDKKNAILIGKELYPVLSKNEEISELIELKRELTSESIERSRLASELEILKIELIGQNEEKEKRAAELIIANKELTFQNEEKEKRAAELVIANKELTFQNAEKEKRASELVIANKELTFQNKEKEERAREFCLANKELAFQNNEKEKRAIELIKSNQALEISEGALRKLTEELEMQVSMRTAELENTNKDLEGFSYSVSHDLRAPIRAISGITKIILEDYGEKFDATGTNYLQLIINDAKRMGLLIDDLLAFSRLGRKQVSLSNINMSSLVESIKVELLFNEDPQRTEFKMETLLNAKGDSALIKQVWINLISNAIKYSKKKPKTIIEIKAFKKEDLIVYSIKDNGAGFEMEYYDKLFGVFQRLHSQEEFDGTGIGLAIVQKVIHRHKGTVWAESQVNEGSTFYFTLPTN
jgi:signal transduction histidine kinase